MKGKTAFPLIELLVVIGTMLVSQPGWFLNGET
jgi:hypothetical protein